MHFSAFVSVAALALPAALAAPLVARQETSPADTCYAAFNETVSGQINRSEEDTRAGWVPVDADGNAIATSDEYGNITTTGNAPASVQVITLSTTGPNPVHWDIVPAADGKQKIRAHNYPSLCASGSGSGDDASIVNFVDCDSDYALWTFNCLRCGPTLAASCEFAPVVRANGETSSVCATPDTEQYGALYLRECDAITIPVRPSQLWATGHI
ncbi:hypothetical protein JCM8097_002378 [Rhodosporidiobolus ruineniae]